MMTGPTKQGMDDLIAKDPERLLGQRQRTRWSAPGAEPARHRDSAVRSGLSTTGQAQRHATPTLKFVNYLGFFIERMQGNDVVGRITPIGGLREGSRHGPAPAGLYPKAIRLVQ